MEHAKVRKNITCRTYTQVEMIQRAKEDYLYLQQEKSHLQKVEG